MDEIIRRYEGKSTREGHRLQTSEKPGKVTIGFMHWGEYQGSDDHHHIYIASITEQDGAYTVGWIRGTETRPFDFSDYANQDDLLSDLDNAIARRSAEVGPGGP